MSVPTQPRPIRTERQPVEEVCEACKKQTRIQYVNNDGFFLPRLKGINHAELGRSKIIASPVTIALEWLLLQYERFKAAVADLRRWLFPRHPRIWGERFDSRLVGRVTFAQRDELTTPIHHLPVVLWSRTWWGQWRQLASGHTDAEGRFALPFDLRAARARAIYTVQFEICGLTHVFFDGEAARPHLERFRAISIRKEDLIGLDYDLHDIALPYWEYRRDTPLPRVVIDADGNDLPQRYSQGRLDAFYAQILPIELTKVKHFEQIKLAPETLSLAKIQADYPENLTVCIERQFPGYTRSDAFFGQRMMNGMNKGTFQPDPTTPGHYWMKYFGICQYDHNDEYALPTTRIRYRLGDDGLPLPLEIRFTGALNAYDRDPWQEHSFTPADGADWLAAKRLARVCGAVTCEVDEHFAATHLNTEQYAVAAYRNLRLNPIATLLLPHLKEVVLIDHAADTSLFRDYLPRATALTARGLKDRLYDIMGVLDWQGWKPMPPLSEAHYYARGEQLFWQLTGEYVDGFIDDHLDDIKRYWFEIYRFSDDLVRHSVPVYLSEVDLSQLPPREYALAQERLDYYRLVYGFDPAAPRQRLDGTLKVVSPITRHAEWSDDRADDLQRLRDACRYIITTATFQHSWINEHQYDDLGEILYSCGGLRFGDKPRGVMAPESDLSIAPDLTRATEMLWFTNFLSRTEYGFITRNEEQDVNPRFSRLLLAREADFAQLGIDVHAIESRTNI